MHAERRHLLQLYYQFGFSHRSIKIKKEETQKKKKNAVIFCNNNPLNCSFIGNLFCTWRLFMSFGDESI